jgi:hypothetical protein
MPLINGRELRQMFAHGGAALAFRTLQEAFQRHLRGKEGGIRPEDVSIRDLAEAAVSREWVQAMDPRNNGTFVALEATTAVNTTAFLNVNGLVVQTKIMEKTQAPEYTLSRITPVTSSRKRKMSTVGAGGVGDKSEEVHEGHPYPTVGFDEDWGETPVTTKRGFIVNVTKEAVFEDEYGLVLSRASEIGDFLVLNKEKRLTDVYAGIVNPYSWRDTAYNTYRTSAGQTSDGKYLWLNDQANPLSDWNDVDESKALFSGMVDAHTGEKIVVMAKHIVCNDLKDAAFKRVLNATEIRQLTATGTVETISGNPIAGMNQLVVAPLLYDRLVASGVSTTNAKEYWLHGDMTKAFGYLENWPVTVVTAPANSEKEFEQDIIARYKASEKGVPFVMNPRYVVRNKNA